MSEAEDAWERSVLVEQLPSTMTPDVLELLFEDFDETGGGAIDQISLDDGGTATLVFEEPAVAERVLGRSQEVDGIPVVVKRPPKPQPEVPDQPEVSSSVKVFGLQAHIKPKLLDLFFKNKQKSGGGPIASIDVDEKEKTAIVTFQSAEDAHSVAEKGLHTIGGCELVVEMATTSASTPEHSESRSVTTPTDPEGHLGANHSMQQSPGSVESQAARSNAQSPKSSQESDTAKQGSRASSSPTTQRIDDRSLQGSLSDHTKPGNSTNTNTPRSTPERRQGEPQDTYTEGHETQGPRATESDDIGGWQNVVDVVGIPVGIHRQMVFILFSSKSESGGGEIKELNYDTNTGRARIRFTHKKDADEVLRRGKIGLQDTFVTVQKPTNPTSGPASKTHPSGSPYPNDRSRKEEKLQEQHHGQVASVTDQDNSNDVSQSNVAVLIRGVTKKCSPQVLSLFFENKKASGGGPLVTIDFNPEGDSARVIFKNPEDAHEVVRRRKFKCEGTLTAEWLQSSTFRNTPVNEAAHRRQTTRPGDQEIGHQIDDTEIVVQIRGIPKQSSEQFISLFFENKKKSGGGEIKRLDFNPGEGSARIVFEAAEDAQEVARRKTFSYQDATLTAEILSPSSPHQKPVGAPGVPEPQPGGRPKLCTVQVCGIPPSSSGDTLKLFFENKRMSGGGPVQHFDYTPGSGTAVVEFEHAEDAERLVQTCPRFNGALISCDILDARASNEKPFALVVRDLDPKVSEQTLQLFFDSERASGGSGVENVEFDAEQRTAVVSFQREGVVERVLSRQPLTLENKRIVLSRLNPAPLVPYVANNVESKSMIVQGIPTKCTKDELVTFLEKYSQNQVSNVVFGIKVPYVTLVVFKRNLDFEHVQRMCARYPLRGVMLSVQQVETLDSIQVCGVKDLSLQSIELYFENERSGGGSIRKAEEHRNQDCVIIKFREPSTFHRVMKKSPHVFEKREMFVRPFIPGLGILPPGHTTSAPPVLIPPPVLRSDINPHIMQFWLQSEENRKAVEQGLLGLHCRVVWPEKAAGNLKLECSLKENDPKLHTLPNGWTEHVNGRFSRIADNYEATDVGIKAQCFPSVVGKLKEVTHSDVMILGVSSEKCLIRLAGKKQAVAEMVDAIRKQEEKIETGLKHETLKIGKPTMSRLKLKVMQLHDQPNLIRQKYPDMQVQLCQKNETATLKGPKENLQQARLDILKFTSGITSRVWTVSNNMLRFLQSEEIASLIDGRLKQAEFRVIWERTAADAITITGATSQECEKGKTLLKNMMRESTMPLQNVDTRFFMEATWTNFKEQTESNKPVRLFVANNEREQSHLYIVGFSDEVDSVEEQAQDYIKQNSIMKETVQVDPGTATLLLNYLNTELIEMRRSRRGFQVECSADSSNSAIEFCGNPESMKAARSKLENISQQMVSKRHPLSGPGMQKAFSGERAKLFCLGMERKHDVVVKLIEKGGATKPRLRGAEASSWRGDAEGQETLVRNLPFKETRHSNVIQTQNIRVTLRKGSIESEQTAVVVNPLDRDLDLKKTATSRALLKAAGGQLEEEFRSNVEKSEVKPGSIIETKGCNLSSWAVYHGVLVGWDSPGDQAERVMQELLRKCFQTAEDNRIPSISIPPAGTGKLGYPAEKVVQIILAEIASFGRRQPANLTDIHIIVHPKDVKKQEIFERAFCSAVGKNEPSQRGNGTHVDRDTSSSLAGSAGDVDENTFKVGSISLIIKTGDITKERAGAIVNSSNPRLDLSRGAVQRAIARAGGDAVERECRGTTVRNGIAVTTAGKMDAKNIIHLAPSSRDRDGLLWQKLVKKALDEAEHLGLKSVAFPAVGTGSGHQDVRDVAKSMVEGLAYFEKNTKPRSVKVVTFTIFQHEMVDTFKDAAKRFSKGGGQKGRSPVGSASAESGALTREIELQIYALSEAIIQDVKREIAEYAEGSMITGEVGDSSIKKLTDKQKKDIRTFASSRSVEVDFETKTFGIGRNSASIRGHADDVMLVKDHISKILKEIQKAKHEKETGKVMSRQVQWEFQDPQGPFKAYPDDVNLKIETAYHNKKATIEWNKGSKRMKITFKDMMGEIVGDPGKKVSVRRMEQGGIGPPGHWSPMNPNEPFKLVPIATTDKVYTDIVADFQKTMGSRTIKKIERVQNPIIYSRYMTHKTQLDKYNPSGTVNEKFLWHGTNHTSAQNIISGGFNRSYCGQHGVAIGNGVYFATAANYSADNFSPANPQGEKCMFYSPVLTGVFTKGSGGLREAPPRPADGSGFTRYDSVVDNTSSPNMYVVFTDTAAYPGHLVTF